MDRELIAMCDTDEIQGKWYPNVGDMVHDGDGECAHWIVTQVFDNGRLNIITASEICSDNIHRNNTTFIPRIEDALDWIMEFENISWHSAMKRIMDYEGSSSPTMSTIKTAIIIYMHLVHDERWDGKAWI